jgi:hypothetical protein
MAKPRPSNEVIEDAARVAKHNVRLLEFLRDWEKRELAELPVRTDNVAVGQGRCQVLQELVKFLDEAPSTVAKS